MGNGPLMGRLKRELEGRHGGGFFSILNNSAAVASCCAATTVWALFVLLFFSLDLKLTGEGGEMYKM